MSFAVPAAALKALTLEKPVIAVGDVLTYVDATTGGQPGQPFKAADLPVNGSVQLFPMGKEANEDNLVQVIRIAPGDGATGLVAYSAICTHLGCAVNEKLNRDNLILCPCHGSIYDPANHAAVRRGPSDRALPGLLIADGPTEMRKAVRSLAEQGADWVKILLTGGLYSVHETVDSGQLSDDELAMAMATARQRGLPVLAHCGNARLAERFVELGGRSVEHGYALDEAAAKAIATHHAWLVPTIGVTHDVEMMKADRWPEHAMQRAKASSAKHADAVRACIAAGVKIATGADLNPIGPRIHAEIGLLEEIGIPRLAVLHAATASGRELNGLGAETSPQPGSVADLIVLEGNPLDDTAHLRKPKGVIVYGRLIVDPRGGGLAAPTPGPYS